MSGLLTPMPPAWPGDNPAAREAKARLIRTRAEQLYALAGALAHVADFCETDREMTDLANAFLDSAAI